MSASNETLTIDLSLSRRTRGGFQTAAYFAAFVALGLTTGSLGPTLPGLSLQTNTGLADISYLFTARSLGYVLGSTNSGKLFDRKPPHMVMGSMLFAMSLAMMLVPLAGRLAVLLSLMVVLGAAESGLDVGANTLLVRLHGNRVGPFMTALHSFFGVGALLAPLIVAQVTSFGYQSVKSYFVLALFLLPIAAFTTRLPDQVQKRSETHNRSQISDRRFVFLIALFLGLYVGAEVGFAGWIFTYATERKLAEPVTAAYLTSLFWGALMAGRILMIPVTARISAAPILMSSLLGSLISLILIILFPTSVMAVFVASIGLGVFMASIFPTALSYASRHVKMTGQVTSWFVVGGSVGSMFIPWLIGQLFPVLGPSALVYVAELALLVATLVLLGAMQRNKGNRIVLKIEHD